MLHLLKAARGPFRSVDVRPLLEVVRSRTLQGPTQRDCWPSESRRRPFLGFKGGMCRGGSEGYQAAILNVSCAARLHTPTYLDLLRPKCCMGGMRLPETAIRTIRSFPPGFEQRRQGLMPLGATAKRNNSKVCCSSQKAFRAWGILGSSDADRPNPPNRKNTDP